MSLYNIKSPKTLILLMSLSLITSTLASDCQNPLLTSLSLGTAAASATTVTGLNFCKSLKASGSSCCPAATINGFQTKADTLSGTLKDLVKDRDQVLFDSRQVIATSTAKLNALKAAATATITFLGTASATFGDNHPLSTAQATTLTQVLKRVTTQVTDSIAALTTGLTTFQNARATCINSLLKTQASLWCLGCDPEYATKGVTTGPTAVTLGSAVCTRLQNDCYNYIANSVTQSNIILANQLSSKLDDITAAVTKIATTPSGQPSGSGDASGLNALATAINALPTIATTQKKPSSTPNGCTSATSCNYICTTLFNSVTGISNDDVVRGGAANTELTVPASRRILLDGGNLSSEPRALLANEWAPDVDESGVTPAFPVDPAGVNPQTTETTTTTNSAPKIISGVFCLVAALVGALLM